MPRRKIRTTLLDPPWLERGGGKIKRGADRHYPLMKTPAIAEYLFGLQGQGIWEPSYDSHIYIWVTNNFFEDGLWLMKQLCYRFIHPITWAKDRTGLGQYRRGQTEHMLFGVSGKAQVPEPPFRTSTLLGKGLIPRSKVHSAKPEEQYTDIESVSPSAYMELFARQVRPGWTSYGKLDGEEAPLVVRQCLKSGQIKEV